MIDKLAWLYLKDRKILSTRSKGKKNFYLPGGKREKNETDWEALAREVQEELSVKLIENSIQFYGIFSAQADGHPEGLEVKMTCYFADYQGNLAASSEIAEYNWLNTDNTDMISAVDKIIFAQLKKEDLID